MRGTEDNGKVGTERREGGGGVGVGVIRTQKSRKAKKEVVPLSSPRRLARCILPHPPQAAPPTPPPTLISSVLGLGTGKDGAEISLK